MGRPDFPLTTPRLSLRPYVFDDLDALYDIQSLPEVTRYLMYGTQDRDQVREILKQRIRADGPERDAVNLAVVLPDSGTLIGDVVLFLRNPEHRQGEIGYVFHPDYGGRGYATEAARVLLRLGFTDYGLHRIIGRLDARNTASARVLERLGMRREAHFVENEIVKGEWTDEVVYAMLEDKWRSQRLLRGAPAGSPSGGGPPSWVRPAAPREPTTTRSASAEAHSSASWEPADPSTPTTIPGVSLLLPPELPSAGSLRR
jgi:RimJ/RimL family protein N-acetyltransferase